MNRRLWAHYPYGAIIKRAVRIVVGSILALIGLVALLTPFTPGSLLLPVGLEILGLRILLENRVRRWADAHPDSRLARAALRFVSWRARGWTARWRQRLGRFRRPSVENRGAVDQGRSRSREHETRETATVGGPEDKPSRPENESR